MNDNQAENFIVRILKGEHVCGEEIENFDDWRMNRSTVDVVEMIRKVGTALNLGAPGAGVDPGRHGEETNALTFCVSEAIIVELAENKSDGALHISDRAKFLEFIRASIFSYTDDPTGEGEPMFYDLLAKLTIRAVETGAGVEFVEDLQSAPN